MNKLNQYKLPIIGVIVGAFVGFAYYYFVGCENGTCAITSKPINSTLYGAMMGFLLISMFKKNTKKAPSK